MNEPKIRFKGFCGEWKEHTLGENDFSIIAGGDVDKNKIQQSGTYPVVANALSNNGIIGYYNDSYRIKGPAVTVTGRGEIGVAVARQYSFTPVVRLLSVKSSHNVIFLANAINCCKVAKESTGVPQLTTAKLQEYCIPIPPKHEEECSVGNFFTALDAQITSSSSRLASLKQVKAASLQAMFPQEGETVPKVRFKGFLGEWKKVKLGEIFCERTESNIYGEMLSVTQHNGIIKASENGRFDNSNSDKSNYKVVMAGDIAYNSMRMWQGASGYSPYEGIVSPAYTVIIPQKGVNSQFFAYLFKTESIINTFRLHSQGLTSDTWNLKYPAFSKIEVRYPIEDAEQQAIATFFTSLDRQIALQSQRLEKLKQIKAACLDKMFV